ncbi:MAG: hypothetical protein FJ224_01415 [Lentisphaerae bacterium]|nr:hypothetical protein [Lentisphaerota bacterium]
MNLVAGWTRVRGGTADRVVLGGWVLLLLFGQIVLPFRSGPLEWIALGWLLCGMVLVRPATCLPLLVMTCPAFMCDSGSDRAWWQELVALVLLLRLLAAGRRNPKALFPVALAAAAVLFLSWPREGGALCLDILGRPPREAVGHFLSARASWYVFPLRQCVQRSLAAAICAGVVCFPAFFSSRRIWAAAFAAGVTAMLAAFGSALLPWQGPHHFLGTTNHARLAGLLFHGAGYNLSYFAFLVALALPWFALAAMTRARRVFAGLCGLLPPALFILQIAFYAAAAGVALMFCRPARCAGLQSGMAGTRRRVSRPWRVAALLFAAGVVLSTLWFLDTASVVGLPNVLSVARLAVGTFIPKALLVLGAVMVVLPAAWLILRAAEGLSGSLTGRGPVRYRRVRIACLVALAAWSAVEFAGKPVERGDRSGATRLVARAKPWLARFEPARADMWTLGAGKIADGYIVRGGGAGTWARFHKHAQRETKLYYAHMHNTYLDLAFEYGLIPAAVALAALIAAAFRLSKASDFRRLWLFYLVPCLITALGQHLLYAFTNVCLLMPAVIAAARVLARNGRLPTRRSRA